MVKMQHPVTHSVTCDAVGLEHRLDTTHRLANTGLIFDQGKAYMTVTVVAKTDTGRHRHLALASSCVANSSEPNAA